MGHSLVLQWIPEHCGIEGNERENPATREAYRLGNRVVVYFRKNDSSALVRNKGENWQTRHE